jgi:signal transduction histidine kinase
LAEEKKKRALSHVSQEIHDSVGQTLSVVKLNLHLISAQGPADNTGILQDTLVLTGKAISELRNISHNLYADNILNFNLLDALQAELHTLDRIGSFKTNLAVAGDHRPLDPSTEFVLFRIVKEGINNIIKHAQASAIDVNISYHPGQFSLCLQDNGIGFSETAALPGQGLINIQDRITLLGGKMQIRSGKNEGTSLVVNLPLN